MQKVLDAQLEEWLTGISDEIFFWKHYMKNKGGRFRKGFEDVVRKNRKFLLEEELLSYDENTEINFIDVGSGPFSRCGFLTDRVKMNCIALDPLADIYVILKKKYNLENGINLRTGFVELLDKQFLENTFDLVHMSNALDHSFNPIIGISQLLYICKVGGKVILRHNENEAEAEGYQGLHQWNLSTNHKEHNFMIWRHEERYNISKLFQDYAEISVKADLLEKQFTRVELVKKKEISIPTNELYDNMLFKIYPFLLRTIYEDVNRSDIGIKPYIKRIKREMIRREQRRKM